MYLIYILKSTNFPKTYVGITDNLIRRLAQHNAGHHPYTKRYTPWEIIYTEECDSRASARMKEVYFKNASGRKWIRYNLFTK